MPERVFFKAGYLSLTYADLLGYLHLGASLKETELYDVLLAFGKLIHTPLDGYVGEPVIIRGPVVLELIHDVYGVSVVVVYGFKKRYRVLNGVQSEGHIFFFNVHCLCYIADMRLLPGFIHEPGAYLQSMVGGITYGAAYAKAVVVPQMAADFTYDHGHGIGGKAHIEAQIKVVYGLDKPYAAHLEQVVHLLTAT